jgi:transcriptional regulator GlxA family with amidase domain
MKSPLRTPTDDPSKDVIPTGAFHFPVAEFKQTRHLGFLLLPEFTLLAFSAAVDPLRIANQLAQKPLYRWVIFSLTQAHPSHHLLASTSVRITPLMICPKTYVCWSALEIVA